MKGQAGARGAEVVLQPLLQAAQDYFGIAPGDDPDLVRQKIAGRALLGDEARETTFRLLFDFFGVRDPKKPPPIGDPDRPPESVRRADSSATSAPSDGEDAS